MHWYTLLCVYFAFFFVKEKHPWQWKWNLFCGWTMNMPRNRRSQSDKDKSPVTWVSKCCVFGVAAATPPKQQQWVYLVFSWYHTTTIVHSLVPRVHSWENSWWSSSILWNLCSSLFRPTYPSIPLILFILLAHPTPLHFTFFYIKIRFQCLLSPYLV